jgi:hypothetical protein
MKERKMMLSTLWIFLVLNYLYCDVLGFMEPGLLKQIMSGTLENGVVLSHGFLLGASILMEISIAMVLLSRILKYGLNRWFNIVAGVVVTLVQIGSLFMGKPSLSYSFFSIIEISCSAFIVFYAWTWPKEVA